MINWSQLCTQQRNLPLWQKQQANYGGCIFAMLSFSACALFSGLWFTRWAKIYVQNFRLAGEDRIWPGLGWFSGLMCAGSVAGAVSWGANMQATTLDYALAATDVTRRQLYAGNASLSRWAAASYILYGLEFMCFIIPKLMMLGRLAENSACSSQAQAADMDRTRRWWGGGGGPDGLRRSALPMMFRAMVAAVVVCSVAGMVALDTAGAYELDIAGVFEQAAAACGPAGVDTDTSLKFYNQTNGIITNAHTATSVQNVCEAIALMITAVSYLLLVARNVALYRRAQHVAAAALLSLADMNQHSTAHVPAVFAEAHYAGAADATVQLQTASAVRIAQDTHKAAAEQQRRLIAACALVLLSFPSRAAFDLLTAYSDFTDPLNPACGPCDACQSQQYHVHKWLVYTPQFRPLAVALSSPLPMACSLWLMMSAWERGHLRRGFDVNKTEEEQRAIAVRVRMGVDLPRPVREVLGA